MRIEDIVELTDEELEPEIIAAEPAIAVEPYPMATIVDPRRPPRGRVKRALAIAGSVGVIGSVAMLRMHVATSTRTPTPLSRPQPRRDETQPIRIVPMPVPAVCPPAATPHVEEAPVKHRDDTPTIPLPPTHRSKIGRIVLKKAAVHAPHRAQPARPVEPQEHGEVRRGALLDPFGQDE